MAQGKKTNFEGTKAFFFDEANMAIVSIYERELSVILNKTRGKKIMTKGTNTDKNLKRKSKKGKPISKNQDNV